MPRRVVTIIGTVQGVGFRPFVYRLARRLGLGGFVQNRAGSVSIEIEGEAEALDEFLRELERDPPKLARIDRIESRSETPRDESDFRIARSAVHAGEDVRVTPDAATCRECLAELFDASNRRYRYPFLNCTQCGPRLTIVESTPYDRERTTMRSFTMCPACQAEYDNPDDRRFHAQPTACAACGPQLAYHDARGSVGTRESALGLAVEALQRGQIGAVKGLGGYHLVCDATRSDVVAELRLRKRRDAKPLAVMVADRKCATQLCEVSPPEAELLGSWRAPIVLLRRRAKTRVADVVAPGNPHLGIMLPNTPLYHLLLHDLGGKPLVVTSGNASDGPIAFDDADALDRLNGVADFFLTHDRPIRVGCDDSVVRVVAGATAPIRRSRGWTPGPISLPAPCTVPTLALGGQLKTTFALGRGGEAIVSKHIGDLGDYENYQSYVLAIQHYEELFGFQPQLLVHDLHPDYASTRYAIERQKSAASGRAIARLAVQHHHAHMAGCLAEHRLAGPALGVIFDGTGFGTDGAIWGGEFLVGDCSQFRRAAHLRYVALPGGDHAVREPWRMAAAHLLDAGEDLQLLGDRASNRELATIEKMIERRINSPLTSSAGRLFDAVAILAGNSGKVSYEAQAAIELEAAASVADLSDDIYPYSINATTAAATIDTRPLVAAIASDVRCGYTPGRIGRKFHATLAEIIAVVCTRLRDQTGIETVVLSGGVFANALLSIDTMQRLTRNGFRAYCHSLTPANDGGLSFGQLAVAAVQKGVADVSWHSRQGG